MEELQAYIHGYTPHTGVAIYAAIALSAIAAVIVVLIFGKKPRPDRWAFKTAALATPIPIYTIILLAAVDNDLFEAIFRETIVIAVAGLYALAEVFSEIWSMTTPVIPSSASANNTAGK